MSFSPSQQGVYRPLAAAAWALHCSRSGADPKEKAAFEAWRSEQLCIATGQTSTTALNKGRHFEKACAHFEELAEEGIKHQLALIRGDLNRIRYAVRKINPGYLARFPSDATLEAYAKDIATQALRCQSPELYRLDDRQIQIVTRAICIDAHRALPA
jgi:hypothetical protein